MQKLSLSLRQMQLCVFLVELAKLREQVVLLTQLSVEAL
jgi:hypothetical protein